MKHYVCLALFLIILGILFCASVYAGSPAADELRNRAAILRQKIELCEKDLAEGVEECCVIVSWENDRHISIAQAKALVLQYLNEAQKAAQKQPAESDKVVAFYKALNDSSREGRSKPIDALITNNQNNRSLLEYSKVINQFLIRRVGNPAVGRVDGEPLEPPRYRPDKNTVLCNIFVWDVTRAMGVEIPHWSREGKERHEVTANEMAELLRTHGKALGWKSVSADIAQQMANEGHPTIAVFQNPTWNRDTNSGGRGHVAIVRPGSVGFSDSEGPTGPAIAQAGRLVINADHLKDGFNDPEFRKRIEFWYHE